jgi:hypothetical protein
MLQNSIKNVDMILLGDISLLGYFLIGRVGSRRPSHVTIAILGNTLLGNTLSEGYLTLLTDMGPYLSKETTL